MIDVKPTSPAHDFPVDERDLIARLRRGDEDAYEQLVRLYGPRMLAVARRMLPGEHDAQDAVQDAFLSAFKAIDQFEGNARLGTWLHQIVVNAALMKLRRRSRTSETSIDDLLPRFADDGHLSAPPAQWAVSLDTAVADRETREIVRQSIARLPDTYRTVLLLRDIEGFSTDKTAEVLETTPGAVKTRLHRARQALRTLLDPFMKGESA